VDFARDRASKQSEPADRPLQGDPLAANLPILDTLFAARRSGDSSDGVT